MKCVFIFSLSSGEPEVFTSKYSQTAILHAAPFRRVVKISSYLYVVPDTVGVSLNVHVGEGEGDHLCLYHGDGPHTLFVVGVGVGVVGGDDDTTLCGVPSTTTRVS